MFSPVLLYIGAAVPAIWGISHLFPTRSVVKGFGEISRDNRLIITMEWIIEAIALIFIGLLVAIVTFMDPTSPVSTAVYYLSAFCLIVLAMVSLFTGYRVSFIVFKLCPLVFTGSAVLILIGALTAV
jgi:hypothetical protein